MHKRERLRHDHFVRLWSAECTRAITKVLLRGVHTFLRELTRLSNRAYTPCRGDKLAKQNRADCALGSIESVLPHAGMLYRWRT